MSDMKNYKHIEHMRNLNDSLIWERMKRCYDYGFEDGQKEKEWREETYQSRMSEVITYIKGVQNAKSWR